MGRGTLLSGDWSKSGAAFDYNTYWHTGGGDIRFGDRTWQQWQKDGMDEHSKITDLQFANPAGGNFTIAADSAAATAGFTPFELSNAGPRTGK